MRTVLITSLVASACFAPGEAAEAPPAAVSLPQLLDAPSILRESLEALHAEAILRDGSVDPTVRRLAAYAQDESRPLRFRAQAWHVASHLHWKVGRLEEAAIAVDEGLVLQRAPELVAHRGRLHEAAGVLEHAIECYAEAVAQVAGPREREELQLRLVLLDAGPGTVGELVTFAQAREAAFRNRAAVVLAILGHPEEALSLYEVGGDETQRRRGHLRRAQWALQARLASAAQESAWAALQGNPLTRDRRYALALMVEAHELDGSWDRLLQRLEERDDLGADGIAVRVRVFELSRRLEDAIELLSSVDPAQLTPESQRTLLRMYGEAGRADEMVARFRQLMLQHPRAIAWPRGLSEHLLETGKRPEAMAAWTGHLAAIESPGDLLAAAEALAGLGFDDLALEVAGRCAREHPSSAGAVTGLRFELAMRRGRSEEARALLEAQERELPEFSPELVRVASLYERLQLPARAVAIWERLARRPDGLGPEDRMRLAWLYDTVGRRDESYAIWRSLWRDDTTPARLRLVEDRLLTMGAETGKLADLAIELEERLVRGEASPRESALLVQIYTKVDDATSAVEIIREQFRRQPDTPEARVAALEEQAKVYRSLQRLAAFERVTTELLELNPAKSVEYLQALVLKEVDSGRNADVGKLEGHLAELRRREATADEGFAAGVLQMIGKPDLALAAYQRALALRPHEAETHLLIAELLAKTDRGAAAIAMLQHYAEHAPDENAFVVAIDGLLNQHLPAGSPVLHWARRRVLERIARQEQQFHLYGLSAEVGEEMGDNVAYLSSLEASLVDAGPRRSTVLRELVAATEPTPKNSAARRTDLGRNLLYSRRLVALGEEMPPDVYLNLGRTLLRLGRPADALSVFRSAVEATGDSSLMVKAADQFDAEGFDPQAAALYQKSLAASAGDPFLRLKLARVQYREGEILAAAESALAALLALVGEQLVAVESDVPKPKAGQPASFDAQLEERRAADDRFTFAYNRYGENLLRELLLSVPQDAIPAMARTIEDRFLAALGEAEPLVRAATAPVLKNFPRLEASAEVARHVFLRTGNYEAAGRMDARLLALFPADAALRTVALEERQRFGDHEQARQLAVLAGRSLSVNPPGWAELDVKRMIDEAIAGERYQFAATLACALGHPELSFRAYLSWIAQGADALAGDPEQAASPVRPGDAGWLDAESRLEPAQFRQLCEFVLGRADAGRSLKALLLSPANGVLRRVEAAIGRPAITLERLESLLEALTSAELARLDFGYVRSRLAPEAWTRVLVATVAGTDLAGQRPQREPSRYALIFPDRLLEAAFSAPIETAGGDALVAALRDRYEHLRKGSGHYVAAVANNGFVQLDAFRGAHPGNAALIARLQEVNAAVNAEEREKLGRTERQWLQATSVNLPPGEVLAQLEQAIRGDLSTVEGAKVRARTTIMNSLRMSLTPDFKLQLLQAAVESMSGKPPTVALLAAMEVLRELDPIPVPRHYEAVARAAAGQVGDDLPALSLAAGLCGHAGLLADERALLERAHRLAPDDPAIRTRLHALWLRADQPAKVREYQGAPAAEESGPVQIFYRESRLAAEKVIQATSDSERLKAIRRLLQMVRHQVPDRGYNPTPVLFRTQSLDLDPGTGGLHTVIERHRSTPGLRPALEGLLRIQPPQRADEEEIDRIHQLVADLLVAEGALESEFARLARLVREGKAGFPELTLWLELAARLPAERAREVLAAAPRLLGSGAPRYQAVQLARLRAVVGDGDGAVTAYAVLLAESLAIGDLKDRFSRVSESRMLAVNGLIADAARVLDPRSLAKLIEVAGRLLVPRPSATEQGVRNLGLLALTELAVAHGVENPALPEIDPALFHGEPEKLVRYARLSLQRGKPALASRALREILQQRPALTLTEAQAMRFGPYASALGLANRNLLRASAARETAADGWPVTHPLRRLFSPAPDLPAAKLDPWLADAARSIPGWIAAGEIERRNGLPVLALVARELHARHGATARATMAEVIRLAELEPAIDGEIATLVAQAADVTGSELPVGLAERLVRHPDILPSALAGLTRRIAAARGPEAALAAARPALEFTRDAALLEALETLSRTSGNDTLAREFAGLREESARLRHAITHDS